MTEEMLEFDLTPIELPVKLGGTDYILKEASGEAASKYRNSLLACTKLGAEGRPVSYVGMADLDTMLLSLCLFTTGEKPALVPLDTIKKWPHKVSRTLAEKVKVISELKDEETKENLLKQKEEIEKKLAAIEADADAKLKKEPNGTGDGSV